jgi:hypothetical protein
MKKIISLAINFFLIVLPAAAQNNAVHFGVKGGLNLSNLKNESGNADYYTGYHFGVFTNIGMADNFSIQPEVSYSKQGAKYADGKEHLIDYVNVPVLGMYQFVNGFRVHTGPQISFKANTEFKPNPSSETHQDNDVSYLENDLSNSDFSWSFGAGYLSKLGLGIDARYNMGLKDIANFGHRKNQVWQFGLFYQF